LDIVNMLFFKCYGANRDLHSLPTRRSSDLKLLCVCVCGVWCVCVCSVWGTRSEEHTSELQSHLNLVCRLLLEKKRDHHQPGAAGSESFLDREAPAAVAHS